jgi:hypothetical protein
LTLHPEKTKVVKTRYEGFEPKLGRRYEMKKILISVVVTLLLILIGITLFTAYQNRIFLTSLYQNYNPDHVNLKKEKWEKIFSFVTVEKHIKVEIYGRPGDEINSGEFVIVRYGLLPLNLKLISPKYLDNFLWRRNLEIERPFIFSFTCKLGFYNQFYNSSKQKYTPTIMLTIDYDPFSKIYKLFAVQYSNCDEISTIDMAEALGKTKREHFETITYQMHSNLISIFPIIHAGINIVPSVSVLNRKSGFRLNYPSFCLCHIFMWFLLCPSSLILLFIRTKAFCILSF